MQTLTNKTGLLDSAAVPSAEQLLLTCIREESAVFDAAVLLIEKLETAANRRHWGDPDSVTQLQKALERVVTAQQKVSKAYGRYSALKVSPSSTVRDSLACHEETLKKLVARINSLQQVFETIRNGLSPQLDTDVQRRSMHSAYQKSLKTV